MKVKSVKEVAKDLGISKTAVLKKIKGNKLEGLVRYELIGNSFVLYFS